MSSKLLQTGLVMNDNDSQSLTFTVALSHDAHEIAHKTIQKIASPIKGKQVYANTLAVYAVDFYLQCMGFNPDWLSSDSRNPLLIQLTNVADLNIQDVGKIECIPTSSNLETCEIPPESTDRRIGYLPVQINDAQTEATLLGFSTQKSGTIALDRLDDLEYAIEYLTNIEQPAIVKLREWLNGLVDTSWETLDRVLNPTQQRLFYRGAVNRGQRIDLSTPDGTTSSILAVDIKSNEISREVDVLVQVYPVEKNELPDGIKLSIGDNTDTMMTAISKSGDNWIQLNFTAVFDEEFTVKIGLGEAEVARRFAI
jgi:Protein of unknown function (DUF1822)